MIWMFQLAKGLAHFRAGSVCRSAFDFTAKSLITKDSVELKLTRDMEVISNK